MHLLSGIKINISDFVKVRSVKEFFVFLKNKIIEAVTGRRPYEEDFEEGEKGYQVWEVLLYFFHISLLFCWRAFLECFVLHFERRRFEHCS